MTSPSSNNYVRFYSTLSLQKNGTVAVPELYEIIFPALDLDKDAWITQEDFVNFSEENKLPYSSEDVKLTFNEIDTKHDGHLDEEEAFGGCELLPYKPHKHIYMDILKAATPQNISLFAIPERSGGGPGQSVTLSLTRGVRQTVERTFNQGGNDIGATQHNVTHIYFPQKKLFETAMTDQAMLQYEWDKTAGEIRLSRVLKETSQIPSHTILLQSPPSSGQQTKISPGGVAKIEFKNIPISSSQLKLNEEMNAIPAQFTRPIAQSSPAPPYVKQEQQVIQDTKQIPSPKQSPRGSPRVRRASKMSQQSNEQQQAPGFGRVDSINQIQQDGQNYSQTHQTLSIKISQPAQNQDNKEQPSNAANIQTNSPQFTASPRERSPSVQNKMRRPSQLSSSPQNPIEKYLDGYEGPTYNINKLEDINALTQIASFQEKGTVQEIKKQQRKRREKEYKEQSNIFFEKHHSKYRASSQGLQGRKIWRHQLTPGTKQKLTFRDPPEKIQHSIDTVHGGQNFRMDFFHQKPLIEIQMEAIKSSDHTPNEPFVFRSGDQSWSDGCGIMMYQDDGTNENLFESTYPGMSKSQYKKSKANIRTIPVQGREYESRKEGTIPIFLRPAFQVNSKTNPAFSQPPSDFDIIKEKTGLSDKDLLVEEDDEDEEDEYDEDKIREEEQKRLREENDPIKQLNKFYEKKWKSITIDETDRIDSLKQKKKIKSVMREKAKQNLDRIIWPGNQLGLEEIPLKPRTEVKQEDTIQQFPTTASVTPSNLQVDSVIQRAISPFNSETAHQSRSGSPNANLYTIHKPQYEPTQIVIITPALKQKTIIIPGFKLVSRRNSQTFDKNTPWRERLSGPYASDQGYNNGTMYGSMKEGNQNQRDSTGTQPIKELSQSLTQRIEGQKGISKPSPFQYLFTAPPQPEPSVIEKYLSDHKYIEDDNMQGNKGNVPSFKQFQGQNGVPQSGYSSHQLDVRGLPVTVMDITQSDQIKITSSVNDKGQLKTAEHTSSKQIPQNIQVQIPYSPGLPSGTDLVHQEQKYNTKTQPINIATFKYGSGIKDKEKTIPKVQFGSYIPSSTERELKTQESEEIEYDDSFDEDEEEEGEAPTSSQRSLPINPFKQIPSIVMKKAQLKAEKEQLKRQKEKQERRRIADVARIRRKRDKLQADLQNNRFSTYIKPVADEYEGYTNIIHGRTDWNSFIHTPNNQLQIGTQEPHQILPPDKVPRPTAEVAKIERKLKEILVKSGAQKDNPDFRVCFRQLRPSDVFESLGEQIDL
ncbi:MAG: hypothetical protein EZS28_000981 [Streblomastix strix]|uniref:EF-hand domain-containing protein n=1 Tax=Streblomastix strix TaxID=222440 RepID=A0A5J4X8D4_9EUKA|nr:MAG: hypothetical protein EZS28_000981 [Streblomastix strix]